MTVQKVSDHWHCQAHPVMLGGASAEAQEVATRRRLQVLHSEVTVGLMKLQRSRQLALALDLLTAHKAKQVALVCVRLHPRKFYRNLPVVCC